MDTSQKKSTIKERHRKLYTAIIEQMEFYFSDSNLQKDRFLKKQIEMTKDGYIDLEIFAKFNKLRSITTDMKRVAKALKFSKLLEVSEDKKSVRRCKPLADPKDVDERTVYVECLPMDVNHDWIKQVFSVCGKVLYVSLPKYKSTGDLKGFGFVEFDTAESAAKACEMMNNPPASASDKPGYFPKTNNKQMQQLSKKLSKLEDHEHVQFGEVPQTVTEPGPLGHKGKKRKRQSSEGTSIEPKVFKFDIDIDKEQAKDKGKTKKKKKRHSDTASSSDAVVESSSDTEHISRKRSRDQSFKSEDGDEEGQEVKRVKVSQKDESSKPSTDVTSASTTETKKKKRRNKRKKKQKHATVPELRVISKKDWLHLKQEYLELQKKNMKALKESLKKQQQEKEAVKNKGTDTGEAKKQDRTMLEFIPDVIVKVETKIDTDRKRIKELASSFAQVAYVDFPEGQVVAHIRCTDAANAEKLSQADLQGYSLSLLHGDEEKKYWDKIIADRERKLSSKQRPKKRGTQKVIEKAHKIGASTAAKHKFFED